MPKLYNFGEIDLIELCDAIPNFMKSIVVTVSDFDCETLSPKTNKHVRIGTNGDFESLRDYDLKCNRKIKNFLRNNTLILLNVSNPMDYITRFKPYNLIFIDHRYIYTKNFFPLYKYNLRFLLCTGQEYKRKVTILIHDCTKEDRQQTEEIERSLLMY